MTWKEMRRDGMPIQLLGVTAGINMALALVEEDLGHAVALSVARELLLYMRRPETNLNTVRFSVSNQASMAHPCVIFQHGQRRASLKDWR
jgi:transcriptional regulator GlxA family with amidase domain